jgi:putative acetyltransferase
MAASARVRFVREADVPRVLEIVRAVLEEFGLRFGEGATTDDDLASLPASYSARGGAFWVAEGEGGEILGTCGAFPVAPQTYELRKMYLVPAARGLGLGKALLDACLAWARAQGGARMVLDTTEKMDRAIAFYENSGFVRDDAQKRGARCTRGYTRDL